MNFSPSTAATNNLEIPQVLVGSSYGATDKEYRPEKVFDYYACHEPLCVLHVSVANENCTFVQSASLLQIYAVQYYTEARLINSCIQVYSYIHVVSTQYTHKSLTCDQHLHVHVHVTVGN